MDTEWLGGRYVLPHDVRDGDRTFRPDVVLWLELPSGLLVASTLGNGGEPLSLAASLKEAMVQPAVGSPRRPSRIRVADERTARELRGAAAGIPILVAPVPELDDTFARLTDAMGATATPSFLAGGEIAAKTMGELFAAAEGLYRIAPWRHVSGHQMMRVDVPSFRVEGAVLSVMGAAGDSFGLLLFSSPDDYDLFALAAEKAEENEPLDLLPDEGLLLRSLSFDRRKDLPPPMLREIEEHHWPVAGPKAYPLPTCVHRDMSTRPADETDIRVLTAVMRAFRAFFELHRRVFDSDSPDTVSETSQAEDGVIVTITAPYPGEG